MARYGKAAQKEVRKAMHEYKKGKLKSGRAGIRVKNPKQAVLLVYQKPAKKVQKSQGDVEMRQGFATIIYILVIILVALGIVGGSLYTKPGKIKPFVGGDCSGPDDNSCPDGYKCIQKCGPPVVREGDGEPGYFCQLEEIAEKPRICPICLASNTKISTPVGEINIKDLVSGMKVYSVDKNGKKIIVDIAKVSSTEVSPTHQIIHLGLVDGREVWVSPGHPTGDGRLVSQLKVGQSYDGSPISTLDTILYWDDKTYDLLPESDTGFYFANGILLGSTLKELATDTKN